MAKKRKTFTDEIREAVLTCGKSRYSICKALGFDQGNLTAFVKGRVGMETAQIDRLCEFLDLHIKKGK